MADLTMKREVAGRRGKTGRLLCPGRRGCNGQRNPDTWWLQDVGESPILWHRPAPGWNPDKPGTLINTHHSCLFTFGLEVVDTRENADRMNRWKAELAGFQGMARTRSRIRVILILLL